MDSIRLKPYEPSLSAEWDHVVVQSKNGTFLHLRNYIGYHAQRFDERSVIFYRNSAPVAIFPCNYDEETIISHGGLTYAGLIYTNELRTIDVLHIFELLSSHFKSQGARSILYKAIPHIYHKLPAEEDLYALFRNQAKLVRRDVSSIIKLPRAEKYSSQRVRNIKKAAKSKLTVAEGFFYSEFHQVLSEALSAHNTKPVHSIDELELLASRFPEQIRLVGAFSEAKTLVSAALFFDFGDVVHSQYLASSSEGKEIGGLDLLLDDAINLRFSGHKYLSFGISTERSGHYLNEGLILQKEGFGGRAVVHDFYNIDL